MALLDDKVSQLEAKLADAIETIRQRLQSVVSQISETPEGLIEASAMDVSILDNNIRTLDAQLRTLGLNEVLRTQREAIDEIVEEILEEAGSAGLPGAFSGATSRAVGALLTGMEAEIASVFGAASGQISRFLSAAILGGVRRSDLVEQIATQLSVTLSQAKTVSETALRSFHRTVTIGHATEFGVEWFAYLGPNDSKTREFCSHWVDLRFKTEDIDKTAGQWGNEKQPQPPSRFGGGYNCRHRPLPLANPRDIKRFKAGPR